MTSPQKKFFEQLERKLNARNYELVVDHDYANRGLIFVQLPGSFETKLRLPFNFQTGRVTLGAAARDDGPAVFPERPNPKFAGFTPDQFGEAIDAICTFVGVGFKRAAS